MYDIERFFSVDFLACSPAFGAYSLPEHCDRVRVYWLLAVVALVPLFLPFGSPHKGMPADLLFLHLSPPGG